MASSAEAGRVSHGKRTDAYQGMPALLEKTQQHAATWFASLAERAARATVSPAELREMLGGPLPQREVTLIASLRRLQLLECGGRLPRRGRGILVL
jgi:hypothetical protein